MSDFSPTIAELTGVDLPSNYEINGESLVPFLFGDKPTQRDISKVAVETSLSMCLT
ncbi:hypothetical protein [Novipirellula caenicola]|uniref:Uncharacterized protein n=1 Tax=Novipirellula caenicola TaxID=1536901 RepID=A0ABP9VS20_9BACT